MSARISRPSSNLVIVIFLSMFLAACGGVSGGPCPFSTGGCCGTCPIQPGPEFLYATTNNTGQILTFSVNRTTGALGTPTTMAGPVMSSGITTAETQFLYVSDTQNGAIDAFSINQTTGALTTVPGSPFSPATPFVPLALVAGANLYVTDLGGVTGFTIAPNGALSTVVGSPFPGGVAGQATLGQSITSPINYFLYATNFIDLTGTISAYKIDTVSGILTPIPGNFNTGAFSTADGIVFDGTMGPFVFVALNTVNQVAAFSVDPTTGALTQVPGSPFPAGFAPVFLALSREQNFLYSMNFFGHSISAYSIASNGALTQVPGSPFLLGDTPGAMMVTPDNFLYVTLPASNHIAGFSITGNGGLSALAGSPFTSSDAVLLTSVQLPPQ